MGDISDKASLGERILKSDMLTDVVVKCDQRTWKLHKVVLCVESQWFKAALMGHFQEAEKSEVIIHEQNPDTVDCVITWIYTRALVSPVFNNQDLAYEACAELYKAADFFLLPRLQEKVLLCLNHLLCSKAIRWQGLHRAYQPHIHDCEYLDWADIQGVNDRIKATYRLGLEKFEETWLKFMEATLYMPLVSEQFNRVLDAVPSFAIAVLRHVVEHSRTRRFHPTDYLLNVCSKCGHDPFVLPGGHFVCVTSTYAYCDGCGDELPLFSDCRVGWK